MSAVSSSPRRAIRLVIFDLHGVLLGSPGEAAGGLPTGEVIAILRRRGIQLRFVTNTSSQGPGEVADLLTGRGIPALPAEVATAGQAMALYLRRHHRGRRLWVIGQPGLIRQIEGTCGDGVRFVEGDAAELIVVGRDPGLSAAKLAGAAKAGARGAALLATSVESTFPLHGASQPGPGATVRAVERAMGRRALVVGKPNAFILEHVLGLGPDLLREALVVGDSAETDVALGAAVGAATALLSASAIDPRRGSPRPDWVLRRLDETLLCVGGPDGDVPAAARGLDGLQ